MRFLVCLLIVMPLVELWVLIQVGSIIGALSTLVLVLLTAFLGLILLRFQGLQALMSARQKLVSRKLPIRELADGVFFAVGGALLLTPGFVTDAVGFACLTPGIRTWLLGSLVNHLKRQHGATSAQEASSAHHIIEGDFERHKDH
ncbi:MAG: FxsA family protein [Cellvibrionaceae bacterium]|nr:FxsA family protein [Cellvibrionaceae bacterium]